MNTATKTAVSNEYIYGYALSSDGEFYSDEHEDIVPLEEATIYQESGLAAAQKEAEKALDCTFEKVAIVIRELP